tara:strand:- start:679 stop:1008 length:330 start_codon:yes stop_codon:yes gene_type:complete
MRVVHRDRFESNGFQIKTVHHRYNWHCNGCRTNIEKEIPQHSWRITIKNGDGFQQWQAWNYGCPKCLEHYLNLIQLVSSSLLEYIQEYNTTEGVVDYVSAHLETIGDEE